MLGIYLFTKGFLLTRLVLDHRSTCDHTPLSIPDYQPGSSDYGCWHPKTFSKAVVVIIDALRYDFTVPSDIEARHWHNALTVFHDTALNEPNNAFLLPFIADPPTATMQRLKGLTTGTLPTFVDAGSSFAGTAIDEDNLVDQLRNAKKTLVHLGDDTWHALFPGCFDANLTHAYDSFNVWDLHTVDDGVTEHLIPLLAPANISQWDVIFAHYLGVDHAGHRYGPDHQAMADKLRQMDIVFRQIIKDLDSETLLVVLGDHGMDAKGDHGGESDDEVEAALWMYSKKGVFGRSSPELIQPPRSAKERPIGQIDLVPTLAFLLGIPVPFNNLGAPIEEAFIGRKGNGWNNAARVNALTAAQIRDYQREYAAARGLNEDETSVSSNRWIKAKKSWDKLGPSFKAKAKTMEAVSKEFSDYQKETLAMCRNLWARFDIPSMIMGIAVLALSLIALYLFIIRPQDDLVSMVPSALWKALLGSIVGTVSGFLTSERLTKVSTLDRVLFSAGLGGILGCVSLLWQERLLSRIFPTTFWSWFALISTFLPAIGFASNSYTIWEDEVLLFFLSTFALVAACCSLRESSFTDRVLGTYQSIIFLCLTRLASLSRLCREEQMPFCRSTYYASATSSTSATWQLFIPFALAILLPNIIKSYYAGTRSYEGSAIFWLGFAFRMGLLGSAIYWTVQAADDERWVSISQSTLKTIRNTLAQLVYAIAFAAGTATFVWANPCVSISKTYAMPEDRAAERLKSVTVLGYANVHGSRYFLLVSNFVLAVALLQKPMGSGAIGFLAWQILALLEIIDMNDLSHSAIGPVVLGLLGNFYFFKTGHQATLASIQWDAAFVGLSTVRYPWSPLLVLLNTFGAQIIAAVAVPLVVLWKRAPKERGLLEDIAKALAMHIAYYAVISLATTMWAGHLRRHLMLFRIFSPRYMTGALALLVVDFFGILIALGAFRWNMLSIADVFGWA